MSYEEGDRVSKALASTILWCNGKRYNVSTIDRNSSCMYGGRFAETLVWEYDAALPLDPGKIVYQTECLEGSIVAHQKTVELIYHGELFKSTEEGGDD